MKVCAVGSYYNAGSDEPDDSGCRNVGVWRTRLLPGDFNAGHAATPRRYECRAYVSVRPHSVI